MKKLLDYAIYSETTERMPAVATLSARIAHLACATNETPEQLLTRLVHQERMRLVRARVAQDIESEAAHG